MNVLRIIRRTPAFRNKGKTNPDNKNLPDLLENHAALAREAAAKGMVLLRNEQALPLASYDKSVALLGKASYDTYVGGTGSGRVTRPYSVMLSDALAEAGYILDTMAQERYTDHIHLSRSVQPQESAWFMPYVSELTWTKQELQQMAQNNDLCILTIQRMAGEGGDRHLTEGDYYLTSVEKQLIRDASEAFHRLNKPMILILNMGSAVEITDIVTYTDAILMAWLPGQEAGHAILDVLTGQVAPQGKLPMPFYVRYEDVPSANNFPSSDGDPNKVCYREGLTKPARTLFDVGYGLTY